VAELLSARAPAAVGAVAHPLDANRRPRIMQRHGEITRRDRRLALANVGDDSERISTSIRQVAATARPTGITRGRRRSDGTPVVGALLAAPQAPTVPPRKSVLSGGAGFAWQPPPVTGGAVFNRREGGRWSILKMVLARARSLGDELRLRASPKIG
jgi:hypothetical protein